MTGWYDRGAPNAYDPEGELLDPVQDPKRTDADPADPAGMAGEPAGLRAQIGAVRDAIRRLITAHVELARTEIGEIGAEIGRVALLGGIAFGGVLLVGLLLPIGGILFLAEWLLGSIGWGVLLGIEALLDLALFAVLAALGVPVARTARDFVIALLIAAIVTTLLLVFLTGPQIGVGLGLFTLLAAWPVLAGVGVARSGIDTAAIKARFYPSQTIETTKETIEWVRERTPLGRKS